MTKDMTNDMTTGNPAKLILMFSVPLLIGNIFQQFYSMVDTIIVGRFLGVEALGAVGLTGAMTFLIIGFIQGITSGFSVLIAQRFGASDEEGLKKAVASSLVLTILLSVALTAISLLLTDPLLKFMNTPSDIYHLSKEYISIIFIGIGATFFYNMLSSVLRAVGDSKTPLYFLIIASILNIVLDIVLIVNVDMGVAGAAYATIISQGFSAILCLVYILKKFKILKLKKRHFKNNKEYNKEHLRIGFPMGIQISIIAIGAIIVQSAVNSFGSTVVGAYTAASKVEQLVMQPAISFGVAMATYTAQNLGAGNIDRIREGVKKCAQINVFIGVSAGVILIVFGDFFINLFVTNPSAEVISYAKQYLNISGLFFTAVSMIFIYRNALQGMGHTRVPMISGFAELFARSIIAFTLPSVIGFAGVCLAGPIAWVCASSLLIFDYYKKMNPKTNPSLSAEIN